MPDLPSSHPQLTPQFCFDTTTLRDFLRLSRASIDDSITQHLNGLVTPARAGYDPSTSEQLTRPVRKRLVSPDACDSFKTAALFPSWEARSKVLQYCATVATSPDPDDPETPLREAESATARERIIDERLDPYSARYFPREARTEVLAGIIRNERGVEQIVRERTWRVVSERCGISGEKWEEAFERWHRRGRTSRIQEPQKKDQDR
ncbi:MAG: hypothetical protein M1816_002260 [Peltula sp. TS41687]|nr:MAG: hypothetical protein M1816_002260 [Peltula sp. TS41687]